MNWPSSRLEDLASPETGSFVDGPFGSNLKTSEYVDSGVPLLRIQNVKPRRYIEKDIKYITPNKARELQRHNYQAGDVVITKLGDPGTACLVPEGAETGIIVADIVRFRGREDKLDKSYLVHYLNSDASKAQIERLAKGSTRTRINLTSIKSLEIPLPPLDEQKRIAAVLDAADGLRAKRRAALARLDDLLQSVFLEMFGDPEAQLPKVTVEDLAQQGKGKIRTGPFGSQLLHSEFIDDPSGVMVLGIDNVVQNRFVYTGNRYITKDKYEQLQRYTVDPGDVLITIMGSCGRCAIVPDDIPTAINTKHLCCISLDQNRCLPLYLKYAFLLHPYVLKQLGVSERGAVMPGLNMGIIKELAIPLPSIDDQTRFVGIVSRLEQQRLRSTNLMYVSDDLFHALQQRAFSPVSQFI